MGPQLNPTLIITLVTYQAVDIPVAYALSELSMGKHKSKDTVT